MALYPGGTGGGGGGQLKYVVCSADQSDASGPWSVQIPDAPSKGYAYLMFGAMYALGVVFQVDLTNGNLTKITTTTGINQDLTDQRINLSYDPASKTMTATKKTSYGLGVGNVVFYYN